MLFRNRMISLEFIRENGLRTEPPPPDSFFFRAFNANLQTAQASLDTKFIQGIKNGNLSPNNYGALTVLDAYYCYNGATSFQIAQMNPELDKEPLLAKLLFQLYTNYNTYNQTFLNVWHILNADCVVPTTNCEAYAHHERVVANYDHPIYTLVVMLPCYYLWYWLSDQIWDYRENNLYGFWIEGCHSSSSAYAIGNFIDAWVKDGKVFDDSYAMNIYSKSMQYEYINFNDACKANRLEGFFHGK
jgi:thiaminase/transcriptional activator TenA